MGKFATYVIRLPDNQVAAVELLRGIQALVEHQGGKITGQSTEDEMTLAEMFEKRLDEAQIDDARAEAAAIAEAN